MNCRVPVWIAAAVTLGTLAGCTARVADVSGHGSLTIAANEVRISVPDAPKAYVQSGGGLVIGGRTVVLTPAEQTLARRYYRYALGITTAGKATGVAGGRLGIAIIGSLFSALWHDDSSIIDRTAHAGAANVKTHVRALCTQLAKFEAAQNALAAAQPAFAPYRVVRGSDVSHCIQGADRATVRKS